MRGEACCVKRKRKRWCGLVWEAMVLSVMNPVPRSVATVKGMGMVRGEASDGDTGDDYSCLTRRASTHSTLLAGGNDWY